MTAAQHVEHLRSRSLQRSGAALVCGLIDPVIALAVLLASIVWFESRVDAQHVILALLVFSMTFPGDTGTDTGRLARRILGRWVLVASLLLLLGWTTGTASAFDQRVILASVIATPIAQFLAHQLASLALTHVLAADGVRKTVVIAGANEMGRMLAERIKANPLLGMHVAGYFDDRETERLPGLKEGEVLGSLSELVDFVKRRRVDVIYCTLPMCSQPRVRRLLEDLHDTTTSIYFVPDVTLIEPIQARVDTVGGIPVIAVCESPYYGFNAVVKRTMDVVLAALVVLLALPLLIAIAVGVKLSAPGPVIFRQRRYGVDGREIVVYKFRTMTCCEDGNVIAQARRDDARITPFGAFLRRFSLDELPQFVNVLQGRMSIVGPRPHAVAHNEMYRRVIRGYMMRHKVQPGITGLAQVRGLRGETDSVDKMRARIECDLEYLRNWSPLLDLKILLGTAGVVLRRTNAY